ncbi:MAG TPA: dihydrolipoamide dehydrogenase, partial [Mangrovimonas sp.]|nr:dihydrolipoamide dehydrogenase [Mangrovimonas sp.]
DVWKLLPETVYTNSGEFQYGFEHNFDYVTIFMDFSSGFNFNDLFPSDNQNQIFRIVVLPVDFVNSSNIDINNYNQVMEFVQ